jgi:hypothetical protein
MKSPYVLFFIFLFIGHIGHAQDTLPKKTHYKCAGINFRATQAYFTEFTYYFNQKVSIQLIGGYEYHKRIDDVNSYDQISSNGFYIGTGFTRHFKPLIKSKKIAKKINANPVLISKIGFGQMNIVGKNIFKGNIYEDRVFTSPTQHYPFGFLSFEVGYEIRFWDRVKLSFSPIILNGNIFQERLPKVPDYSLVLGKSFPISTGFGIHYIWK